MLKETENSNEYRFKDFTRSNFVNLIKVALQNNFIFRTYDNFDPNEKFIIWRHDIDISPQAAVKLASLEKICEIRSTYFVGLHSEFYNFFEREVTNCFLEIQKMGHNIGLHFDSHYYNIIDQVDLPMYLERERKILEDVFEERVSVFTFHIIDDLVKSFNRLEYAGMINAYSYYFYKYVTYCSDSFGYWRFRRLEDILNDPNCKNLQALTHPELWSEEVTSPKERIDRCIDGRREKTKKFYQDFLKSVNAEIIDWK